MGWRRFAPQIQPAVEDSVAFHIHRLLARRQLLLRLQLCPLLRLEGLDTGVEVFDDLGLYRLGQIFPAGGEFDIELALVTEALSIVGSEQGQQDGIGILALVKWSTNDVNRLAFVQHWTLDSVVCSAISFILEGLQPATSSLFESLTIGRIIV